MNDTHIRLAQPADFLPLVRVQLEALTLVRRVRWVAVAAAIVVATAAIMQTWRAGWGTAIAVAVVSIAALLVGTVLVSITSTVLLTWVWLTWRGMRVFVLKHDGRLEAMLSLRQASGARLIAANHARRRRPRLDHAAQRLRRAVAEELRGDLDRDGTALELTAASRRLVPIYAADIDGLVLVDDVWTRTGLRLRMVRPPAA